MTEPPLLFFAVLFLFVLISLGEVICYLLWLPFYFRTGIPVFSAEIPLPNAFQLTLDIPQLEQKLKGFWGPRVVFKQLQPNEYAFRQSFTTRNPAVGLITFDTLRSTIIIKGYVYWSLLFFPVVIFVLALSVPMGDFFWLILPFFVLIVLINLAIQRSTYRKIATAVQEITSNDHPH
jgi:hypothetical protein